MAGPFLLSSTGFHEALTCQFRYADLVATIAEDPALAREQKEAILYHNAMRVFWGE